MVRALTATGSGASIAGSPLDVHHPPGRLRAQVSSTLASAAGPYGYTISLGGATVLASGHLGSPRLLGALLLVFGAVAAFVGLDIVAQGSLVPRDAPQDRPPSIWGNAHVPSAGAAVSAVWGLLHVLGGSMAWLVTGFAATLVYFLVTAVQRMAIGALIERRSRSRRLRSRGAAPG